MPVFELLQRAPQEGRGFGLLMPTPGPSLLPDRPTPQARVRQNKPKAKAGASLKLGSLFKPSCADPSVCSQGNSSLCSLSCRSATHDPGPQLLPSSRGGRLGSEEPGTTPPHHGEGKKQRQDETPAVPAQRGKRQGERKGERKGQGPGTGPSKRKSPGEGQGQSTLEGTSGPHKRSPHQEATSSQ